MTLLTALSPQAKSLTSNFYDFCSSISLSQDKKDSISCRYKRITKQLNKDFWDTDSELSHSLYVGSYGRGTCINKVSDIDILFQMPYSVYKQYNSHLGNGQSALLQAVKNSLTRTYSTSHLRGDGQVVQINFDDNIKFEIVPVFINKDERSFTFPDSNNGGSWKITDPKSEQNAISSIDKLCNYNLKHLCRMARSWKSQQRVPISGMLIDTLAYSFIQTWKYKDKSYTYYDWMFRDFLEFLFGLSETQEYWLAPGSKKAVYKKDNFHYKAKTSYNMSLDAIEYMRKNMEYSAIQRWKEILGNNFR
ncbi:MAG: nucleotidyltransferase [Alphaproteobacteria bacterium CG11_big_fil_rev_8_21_14_0_20_39_49]|nr:MAG: nucleotidyltransferase [Alphaproteobacteria bacterium CG11_big_fil_rev_8_21_14_0_20_39_49]